MLKSVRSNYSSEKISKMYAKELGLESVSHFTDKFAKAIEERDFWGIGWINNGLNDKAKKIFSNVTGYKLPKTQKGSLLVLLDWAKIDYLDYDIKIKEKSFNAELKNTIEKYGVPENDINSMFEQLKEKNLWHEYEEIRGGIRLKNLDGFCDLKSKGIVKLRPVIKSWVAYMKAVEMKDLDNLVNEWKESQ